MIEPLRPLSLGEILDRTVHLYRRNFRLLASVAVAPSVVIVAGYALQILLGNAAGTNSHAARSALYFVELPLMLLGVAYAHAALTSAAVGIQLGKPAAARSTIFGVLPRYGRFLWLTTLQVLIVFGIPCAAAIIALIPIVIIGAILKLAGSVSPAILGGSITILASVTFLGFATWLLARFALAVPVCWVENKSAWASLKRSAALSKDARGRVAMAYVFYYTIAAIVIGLRLGVLALVMGNARHSGHPLAGTPLAITQTCEILYSFLTQVVLAPLAPMALTILYFDQRVRREGYDIEWMMEQAGLTTLEATGSPVDLEQPQVAAGAGSVKEL